MSVIAILQTVSTILPIITKVVQGVEAVHEHYTGTKKKELALDLVKTLYNGTEPAVPYEALAPHVSSTIDTLVNTYNTAGDFVKAVPPVETEAA